MGYENSGSKNMAMRPRIRNEKDKDLIVDDITGGLSPVLTRLSKKIQLSDGGCWIWIGRKDGGGYGQTSIKGKQVKVHRLTWMIRHKQPLTSSDHICHTCDNPSCVNPDHLFKANNKVNRNDYYQKIKRHGKLGKLSDTTHLKREQVLDIRARSNRNESLDDIAHDYSLTATDIYFIVKADDYNDVLTGEHIKTFLT